MNSKTVTTKDGTSIDTNWVEIDTPDATVIEVTATAGTKTHVHRITLGASDGAPVAVTAASLQAHLDETRQKIVEIVHARNQSKLLLAQLDQPAAPAQPATQTPSPGGPAT